MGTLYQLVDGWTKQPWDGERYSHLTEKLFGYLNREGLSMGYLGDSVSLLQKTIEELNESIELGLDNGESTRERLVKLRQREKFAEGARDLDVDFDTLEFKVLKPIK